MKSRMVHFLGVCAVVTGVTSSALADTIVQSSTAQLGASQTGTSGFGASGPTWNFQPFSVQGGALTSVEFSFDLSGTIGVYEFNPFPVPVTEKLGASLNNRFLFRTQYPSDSSIAPLFDFASGGNVSVTSDYLTIPSNGSNGFKTDFQIADTFFFTDAFGLSLFTGEVTLVDPTFRGMAYIGYGSASVSATEKMTITYNYTVPETGATALFLGSALFGLLVQYRRKVQRR